MRLLFLLTFAIMSNMCFSQSELEWSVFHPKKKEWLELGKKGSVQELLIKIGELPDPFYGLNENKFGWVEEHKWEFKSLFFNSKDELQKEFIELEFPSLDTYAEIYLNDSLLGKTENAFIPHRFFIKNLVKENLNEIRIVFTPPVIYHSLTYDEMGYTLPAPNDVHENAVAPLTRKPQYQFGWDWSLRMNTIGLNKSAKIHAYNQNRILNAGIQTISIENENAKLRLDVEMIVSANDSILLQSELFGEIPLVLKNGKTRAEVMLKNPRLWWCQGQGEPNLYHDNWKIKIGKTTIEKEISFGIRTTELVQEKDEWGTSYYFKLNGRTIFCKGADYIPQDIFPAKVTDEQIREMVDVMAESNFNMVRVWGGGYYPDDVFFQSCDEKGIMVWQDFMFACAMYPGDSAFLENVRKEFEYQVPRIAKHPSVMLFNGNNEVEVAWGNWGFQIKYGLYGKSAKAIEKSYDDLFKKLAPSMVEANTNIPYIHTSPLSNWGKQDYYNHGSQHYWGVWHGADPIEDFGKKIGRFNAEYGFQSFPEFNTLRTFSDEAKDWDLNSDVMKHHQKSYVGNSMILKHAKKLYGNPRNFHEFVYFSQLTQAKAVGMAVAGHRIDFPRCGGTLVWQLNDCWPVSSWSSLDYFNNWKALQYQLRADFQSIAVVEKYNDLKNVDYYLVSDHPTDFSTNLLIEFFDLKSGKRIYLENQEIELKSNAHLEIKLPILKEKFDKQNALLRFSFTSFDGEDYVRNFVHQPKEYKRAHCDDFSFEIILNEAKKTGVLILKNKKFLQDAWISCEKLGVHFEENFVQLLPGEHRFKFTFEEKPWMEEFHLMWR